MHFMNLIKITAASAAVALALTTAAFGQSTVVAPAGFENVDGPAISDGPLGMASANANGRRYQQVYSADFFDDAVSINEIQFRAANAGQFRPDSITASNTFITLSTTASAANAAGIAGSYDSNVGSDSVVVYSGPLTLARGAANASGPQAFDYGFVLQTPFVFDPSMGNLLLDVTVPAGATLTAGPGFGAVDSFDAVVDQPDVDGIASKVGNFGAVSTGLVTQFTTTAVPEPTLAAVGAMVGGLLLRRRS